MIRGSINALLLFSLSLLAYWALFGIFNDTVVMFKYLNFAGPLIPLCSLLLVLLFCFLSKGIFIKITAVIVSMPAMVIPFYILHLDFNKGEYKEGNYVELNFITFNKMGHNKNYRDIFEIVNCDEFDIVQVQEMDDVEEFKSDVGPLIHDCNIIVNEDDKGLVTFSKYKMETKETNGVNLIEVEVSEKIKLYLVNIHAVKILNQPPIIQDYLINSLESLAKDLNAPLIISGDFNATPFNKSILRMKQNFNYAKSPFFPTMNNSTWPGEARKFGLLGAWIQIDYIFYKNLNLIDVFVHDSSYSSDHYPMQAIFQINVSSALK